MKLKIIRFDYGNGGGGASARVYASPPASAFERHPYLGIEIGYVIRHERPEYDSNTQELVLLPLGANAVFLLVGFLWEQPVFADREQIWPHPSEYRNKLARMVANMVANAELASLDDTVPTVFSQK